MTTYDTRALTFATAFNLCFTTVFCFRHGRTITTIAQELDVHTSHKATTCRWANGFATITRADGLWHVAHVCVRCTCHSCHVLANGCRKASFDSKSNRVLGCNLCVCGGFLCSLLIHAAQASKNALRCRGVQGVGMFFQSLSRGMERSFACVHTHFHTVTLTEKNGRGVPFRPCSCRTHSGRHVARARDRSRGNRATRGSWMFRRATSKVGRPHARKRVRCDALRHQRSHVESTRQTHATNVSRALVVQKVAPLVRRVQ